MILFEETGKIITYKEPYQDKPAGLRPKKMDWGNTALVFICQYKEGYIKTSQGTKVIALEFIKDTQKIELFDQKRDITIKKPNEYFNQFNFNPSYNCFGYCFAESKFCLPDPTPFINEEYKETTPNKAEIILFKGQKSFGNNNEEHFMNIHAVKVLPNGNVSFKPGINQLIENVSKDKAIHDYDFNHKVYLRKHLSKKIKTPFQKSF